MAEPLVYPDSPLADYLKQSVPSELPTLINSNQDLNKNDEPLNFDFLFDFFNRLHELCSQFDLKTSIQLILSNFQSSNSSTDPSRVDQTESFDHVQARLSERLKYLICSSFLLNPQLSPAFYDSVSTPPMGSDPDPISTPSSTPPIPTGKTHTNPYIPIAIFSLLILNFLPKWLTLLIIIVLGSTFFLLYPLLPSHQSTSELNSDPLHFQSKLVPTAAQLVTNSQAMDVRISRAMGAVREVECVALGLAISDPMPPVSRLESASFALGTADNELSTESPSLGGLASSPTNIIQPKLHAIGLRKVVKSVLDQARHLYEHAAVEIETVLTSFSSNPDVRPPLDALMEMYGCSREGSATTSNQPFESARTRTLSQRSNRRESLLFNSSSPRESSDSQHSLNRYSWQPSLLSSGRSPPRIATDSDSLASPNPVGSFEDFKASMLRRSHPRARLAASIGSPSEGLYANALGLGTIPTSPHNWSSDPFSPSHHACSGIPEIEPVNRLRESVHHESFTSSSPTPSPRVDRIDKRISLGWGSSPAGLRPSPSLRGRTRPTSMMAQSSIRRASSYGPIIPTQSPAREEHTPRIPDDFVTHNRVPEIREPLSLIELQASFDRMHISRKRILCGLLALDFSCPIAGAAVWSQTVEIIQSLVEAIERLGNEVSDGMSLEFGPGSFETKAVPKAVREVTASTNATQEERRDSRRRSFMDFAPPAPPGEADQRRVVEVLEQLKAVDCVLRTLSAKVSVCVEELGSQTHVEEGRATAMGVHESMRADLERLGREWDESRCKMRRIVEGEKILGQHRLSSGNRARPESFDSISESVSGTGGGESGSGRTSSVFSSEALTPVEEDGPEIVEDEDTRTKNFRRYGLEEVFEAVVTNRTRSGSMTTGQIKLTREERIRLARQKRESMPVSSKIEANTGGVVTELKDVLSVLKARRLKQLAQDQQVEAGTVGQRTSLMF
ncbi:uncharacterized protein MELLADRAFT_76576 [Melampsora larici-populina 98AG31]|uniref:Myosin-binding domain-containing protein n=1 Tax=Melampsora larici-populina (strain 98AG31 / pathotype 3-4-7) TaxID=747676 RepID=F4R5S4_MELLP|nr:uncharacterized protein MELLADRAFT_76576 [Melampsora larici-populina 98AG31]EGG12205.1 hypothetical protein MELLADRAFT_76576 [Melampsora larici-populina 98AG31]